MARKGIILAGGSGDTAVSTDHRRLETAPTGL